MSPRLTTAGRLLNLVSVKGLDLSLLARHLGIPVRRLEDCRDGTGSLELEEQMLLAALVMVLAPQFERLARQLHGQAQSALRVRDGEVASHTTYYQAHHWSNVH